MDTKNNHKYGGARLIEMLCKPVKALIVYGSSYFRRALFLGKMHQDDSSSTIALVPVVAKVLFAKRISAHQK